MNQARLLLTAPISVRWGDMDAFGHANNSVYATYVEEARLRWFATIDCGWLTTDVGPVLAAYSINFRLPIEWPAELRVELLLQRVGVSSLTLGFRIVSDEPSPRFYADGSTVLVWVDRKSGKSVPLPEPVRRAAAT
jgi:acyl-CoA thioester hydrolase